MKHRKSVAMSSSFGGSTGLHSAAGDKILFGSYCFNASQNMFHHFSILYVQAAMQVLFVSLGPGWWGHLRCRWQRVFWSLYFRRSCSLLSWVTNPPWIFRHQKRCVCVCVCLIPKASKIDGKPDYLVVTILNPKQTLGQTGKNMQKWEWVKLVNDSGLRNEVGIHHSLSIHCAALWSQNYGCDWACDLKCGKFTSINGRIGRVVRPPGPVGVLDPARNPQMAVHIKMDRESPKSPKWPKFCSWICQILHVQGLNPNQILAPQFCTMLCLQYWHPLLLHSGVVVWKRYPAQRVGGRFSRLRCWVASLLSEGWWLWMDLERPGPVQRNQLASDGVMKKLLNLSTQLPCGRSAWNYIFRLVGNGDTGTLQKKIPRKLQEASSKGYSKRNKTLKHKISLDVTGTTDDKAEQASASNPRLWRGKISRRTRSRCTYPVHQYENTIKISWCLASDPKVKKTVLTSDKSFLGLSSVFKTLSWLVFWTSATLAFKDSILSAPNFGDSLLSAVSQKLHTCLQNKKAKSCSTNIFRCFL